MTQQSSYSISPHFLESKVLDIRHLANYDKNNNLAILTYLWLRVGYISLDTDSLSRE
jgi:hypothetical protein